MRITIRLLATAVAFGLPAAMTSQAPAPRAPVRQARCDVNYTGPKRASACADSLQKMASPTFQIILADEYLRSARWDDALTQLREVQRTEPRTANPWRDSVIALLSRGNVASARVLMETHGSWVDDTLVAPVTRLLMDAFVSRALGNDSAAIRALRAASQIVPDARTFVQLGDLYSSSGSQTDAIVAYRAATKRSADSSTSAHAWGAIGKLTAQMGRPGSAAFFWERALQFDSNYFASRRSEAVTYQSTFKTSGVAAKPVRLDSSRAANVPKPDSVAAAPRRP